MMQLAAIPLPNLAQEKLRDHAALEDLATWLNDICPGVTHVVEAGTLHAYASVTVNGVVQRYKVY